MKNKSKCVESLSYYILKLYYDNEGNYRDFFIASGNFIKFSNDITEKINGGRDREQKYYGFDYLFLPLKKENSKKYNEIIKIILNNLKSKEDFKNDLGILSDINKSDIDILYCIISNLFLSHLTDSYYFETDNYTSLKKWIEDKLKQKKFENLNDNSKKNN